MKYLPHSFILICLFFINNKAFSQPFPAPPAPDYSKTEYWVALPDRKDAADITPADFQDMQATASADVFYLHPTTYKFFKKNGFRNAPLDNEKLNESVERPVAYQASIFNGAGRVYAPHYRQAHFGNYFEKDKAMQFQVFDLAYQDIKAAFSYYLKHYNKGRPIIIASHSQGTTHGKRLVADFFDGKPLQKQLVAAYLVGMPIKQNEFKNIKPCETALQTGCFCSWNTFKENHHSKYFAKLDSLSVTNPLSWENMGELADKNLHEGAVLYKMKTYKNAVHARVERGMLWVNKPKFPGSFLYVKKSYHAGDFNLFYVNVRNNAILRVREFMKS